MPRAAWKRCQTLTHCIRQWREPKASDLIKTFRRTVRAVVTSFFPGEESNQKSYEDGTVMNLEGEQWETFAPTFSWHFYTLCRMLGVFCCYRTLLCTTYRCLWSGGWNMAYIQLSWAISTYTKLQMIANFGKDQCSESFNTIVLLPLTFILSLWYFLVNETTNGVADPSKNMT